MVSGLDIAIGQIVKKLKQEGLYENSIILFSSDVRIKRGCPREAPKLGPFVTGPSPIWLKIGMVAGNDLKLSHAKYFWTFISEKIA